jgi:hypothetical protein
MMLPTRAADHRAAPMLDDPAKNRPIAPGRFDRRLGRGKEREAIIVTLLAKGAIHR